MHSNFYCKSSHLNLYEKPSYKSKIASQILYGEKFRILLKKKQKCFMPLKDRMEICRNLRTVDEVRTFEDCNDGTACQLLQDVYNEYEQDVKDDKVKICFMNGGDRSSGNDTPEQKYVDEYLNGKVEMVYGVGGFEKIASSSDYLRNWVNETMKRYGVDFKLESKYSIILVLI